MNKKKLCFVITDALSFNILCRDQLEYFIHNSHIGLTLICGGSPFELDKLRSRNVGLVYDCGFVRTPSFIKDISSLSRLIFFFLFNRFDLVVYSTPKALLLGSVASFLTRQRRRIALVRGRAYENFTGKKRDLYTFLDKFSFFISHKVVFISTSLMIAFRNERLVTIEKSEVVGAGSSNGVNISKFSKLSVCNDYFSGLRAQLGYSFQDVIILLLGRICHDKGINDLAQIVARVTDPKLKFLVVGSIEDPHSASVVEVLTNSTRCVKYLPHRDNVSELFSIADIHLFLSHREGFGNVAIEAAASGVATLAYDVVGVRDSVNHGTSGLRFPFGDNKRIAECLDLAALDISLFKARFSGASKWAAANFDQAVVWKNYLDFFCKEVS